MKKLTVLLLACLLLFSFAGAEETVYAVIDLDGMLVDVEQELPENMILLMRDSSASVFNRVGLFQPEMLSYMEDTGMYALMIPANSSWEAYVYAYTTDMADMDDATDFGMQSILVDFEWLYTDAGYQDVKAKEYRTPWHRMVYLSASCTDETGTPVWMAFYATILGGRTVMFELCSWGEPITEEASAWLRSLVDHIWIYEAE